MFNQLQNEKEEYLITDKVVCIIQARLGSTRLPGKVLKDLNGKTVLQHIVERVKRAKEVDEIIVATSTAQEDLLIYNYCKEVLNVNVFLGDEEDVLSRVLEASEYANAAYIVDITGDCPLIDPNEIDFLVKKTKEFDSNYVYVSNVHPRILPDGFDIQVYTDAALYSIDSFVENKKHRAHTGWNILQYSEYLPDLKVYNKCTYPNEYYHPNWFLTLDTIEDYTLLRIIFKHFKANDFTMRDVVKYLLENPVLLEINSHIPRKIPGNG